MNKRILIALLAGVTLLTACTQPAQPPVGSDTVGATESGSGEVTSAPDAAEERDLACGWYGARMDFAKQTLTADPNYLLSDVLTLKAGDVVRFSTAAPADGEQTTGDVLMISSWKAKYGQTEYVFDPVGVFSGGADVPVEVASNGTLNYIWTADEDQRIRICVKRGCDGKTPVCKIVSKNASPAASAGMEVNMNWVNGYVGSSTNEDGYQNKVYNGKGGYYYSDVICLGKAGTRVRFVAPYNGLTSSNAYVVSAWKLQDGEWVLDLDGNNIPGPKTGASSTVISYMKNSRREYCYVSGKDNECIRFCYVVGNGVADKPVTSVSIEHTGETQTFGTVAEWVENDKSRAYFDLFEGKTINVIGDSLFTPANEIHKDNVWISLLAGKYGMTYVDRAISGSTISNKDTNDNPMVDRVAQMPDNDPDIVIFEGCRNDYNHNVPLGSDDPNDFDTTTLKGAIRYMLRALRQKYPNATIICMNYWDTPSGANATGVSCNGYAATMLKLCRDLGYLTIDLMDTDLCGVNMQDALFRELYSRAPNDVSHLTDRGMRYAYPYLEKALADVLAKAWAK